MRWKAQHRMRSTDGTAYVAHYTYETAIHRHTASCVASFWLCACFDCNMFSFFNFQRHFSLRYLSGKMVKSMYTEIEWIFSSVYTTFIMRMRKMQRSCFSNDAIENCLADGGKQINRECSETQMM